MCPICGLVNRDDQDLGSKMQSMMNTLNHTTAAGAWLISDGMVRSWNGGIEPVKGQALGQLSLATRELPPERPSRDCSGNLVVLLVGNIYNAQELKAILTSTRKLPTGSVAEIIAHLLEETHQGDLSTALKQVSSKLDGAYCLAASNGKQIVLIQDPTGLIPAYYDENDKLVAFASEKKALWRIGLRNVRPLRAGMLASFDKDGTSLAEAFSLRKMADEVSINDLATAVDSYCALLRIAVGKRLRNLRKVGVLCSGGVDSGLIAKLVSDAAAERGIAVTAYTGGADGADDIEYAEDFARELGLNHKVRRLRQDEIESYIPRVISAVEARGLVQIEAGIGVYAAMEAARDDGVKVVFSGQGPDELWGGYSWYPRVIARDGYQGLQERMWDDLERTDIETFDRERKVALALGMEQVFPYVDIEVIKLAMSVSPRLKITSAEDHVGKHPHREAAKRLGVPIQYADREKNAAQHGTGVHDILDTIARKNGFTQKLVALAGYSSEEVSKERLGSSIRYGYLYGEKELWQVPEHVQFFLDSIAYQNNLLNEAERSRIEEFLRQAGISMKVRNLNQQMIQTREL
jgi:asparagine synthase (glutamine-hydrolysing)